MAIFLTSARRSQFLDGLRSSNRLPVPDRSDHVALNSGVGGDG
jgi:hypothetical protein